MYITVTLAEAFLFVFDVLICLIKYLLLAIFFQLK